MSAVLERANKGPELKASVLSSTPLENRPNREEAEAAVKTLIQWAGDDPSREGLLETPKRVVKAYEEFFAGYETDIGSLLSKTFEEVEGYDDLVMLTNIRVDSHCEHHIVPIHGIAHVAYLPNDRVVGISKLARIVEAFSRRLQTQETMTAQIADAIEEHLNPRGIAVVVGASHGCMSYRGVKNPGVNTWTRQFRGVFREERYERQFWDIVRAEGNQ